jgi:hypothetical protein
MPSSRRRVARGELIAAHFFGSVWLMIVNSGAKDKQTL